MSQLPAQRHIKCCADAQNAVQLQADGVDPWTRAQDMLSTGELHEFVVVKRSASGIVVSCWGVRGTIP